MEIQPCPLKGRLADEGIKVIAAPAMRRGAAPTDRPRVEKLAAVGGPGGYGSPRAPAPSGPKGLVGL